MKDGDSMIRMPGRGNGGGLGSTAQSEDEPRVQLGSSVRGLGPSATVAINERSDDLRRRGRRILKLGLGQSPFPVPESVAEALRANAHQKDYLPTRGLHALRQAVADHHQRTYGIQCEAEDVLIGPGSKELMFLLQLVYDGDLVLPTPAWVSYAPQARILHRDVTFLPTEAGDHWRMTPDQLDQLCRQDPDHPRILVLNYPSNPTGASYSRQELEAIAEVARRYRLVLLSDEIYGKLHHTGEHGSIAPFYAKGTIFSGGLSKWCGAGGWRLGVFVFPRNLRWLLRAMAAVASETFTSTSAPIQHAAVRAFEGGPDIDRYLAQSRRILRALGGWIHRVFHQMGVRIAEPEGGFYLFPDFFPFRAELEQRGIRTSAELAERLLEETHVATLPGQVFGRPPEELTLRLAYVNFDGAAALEAAEAMGDAVPLGEDFLRLHCGETLEAVECIRDWIESR